MNLSVLLCFLYDVELVGVYVVFLCTISMCASLDWNRIVITAKKRKKDSFSVEKKEKIKIILFFFFDFKFNSLNLNKKKND